LTAPTEAVIFDLDGVIVSSEPIWAQAREAVAREHGGRWPEGTARRMIGMSSPEWSAVMHDELGVGLSPAEISETVVERLAEIYRRELPLIGGAAGAVRRLAARWPLAIASSANRPIIELVLELADLAGQFAAIVSSEEVPHGKPAPDVYLEASSRLGVAPDAAAVVEDSTNGIIAAKDAGMAVVAIPGPDYPPDEATLERADLVLGSIVELTAESVRRAAELKLDPGPVR
jgi:HAD superfamily hydrolase (TIGR01509 family)